MTANLPDRESALRVALAELRGRLVLKGPSAMHPPGATARRGDWLSRGLTLTYRIESEEGAESIGIYSAAPEFRPSTRPVILRHCFWNWRADFRAADDLSWRDTNATITKFQTPTSLQSQLDALAAALVRALLNVECNYESFSPTEMTTRVPSASMRMGVIYSARHLDLAIEWSSADGTNAELAWGNLWDIMRTICIPPNEVEGWADTYDIPLSVFDPIRVTP